VKNLILFFVICISFISVNAQNLKQPDTLKLTSVEVSSGKGAVASGLYGYVTFSNKKSSLMLTLSAEDLEMTYLYKVSKSLFIGPNVGYWMNIPYASAQIIWNPSKYFGTFHWAGYGAGEPGAKLGSPRFFFSVQQTTVTLNKNFSANYTLIHYLDNVPTHVGNVKYTGKVNKNFTIYTNVGWDFTKETQLLQIGIKWSK
jgi:hypothetical protein